MTGLVDDEGDSSASEVGSCFVGLLMLVLVLLVGLDPFS